MTRYADSWTKLFNRFIDYLVKNQLRPTQERITILKEVYKYVGRFDAESLYIKMKGDKSQIITSTIYNTLNILLASNILLGFRLKKKATIYKLNVSLNDSRPINFKYLNFH